MHSTCILIVDDDEEIRFGTSLRLQSFGYRVETAVDGKDGIDKAISIQPDLILMDIRMPQLDGLSAMRYLRTNPSTAEIPCVIASASPNDQGNALDSGAEFFLRKPYSNDCLMASIESALRARSQCNLPSAHQS